MLGAGKYDDLCTYVREQAGVDGIGGAIVMVLGGKLGSGFSVQISIELMNKLPDMLEELAREIRANVHSIHGG